jgi:hypothetical protein
VQPGQPQLSTELVRDGLERVELAGVLPGDHDRDLEAGEPGVGQVSYGAQGGPVRAGAAECVVDLFGGAVEGDLHVHVVAAGEPLCDRGGDLDAVGGELADVLTREPRASTAGERF